MPTPINDNFTQAQSIAIASFPINADNSQATTEVGEPTSHYNSLWYNFTSPNDGTLNLTIGSAFEIAVYTNNILQELNPVTPLTGSGNNITVPILNSLAYSIVVYSVTNSVTGAFTLSANFTQIAYPSNDNFANAIALLGTTFIQSSDNTLATIELYEPYNNYFSLWYSFTPSMTGYFTLAQSAGIALNFSIFNGTDMENAIQITSSQSSIALGMTAGITYYIAVSSQNSTTYGKFSFAGTIVNQFPLNYIGPQSSPALAYNSSGLKSTVVDPSNGRIYVASLSSSIVINYSDTNGNSWAVDRTITFANPPYFQISQGNGIGLFIDENGNLVVTFITNDGSSNFYFNASVRNKGNGMWTDYTSPAISVVATGYSFSSDFCQGNDGMIHCVMSAPTAYRIADFFNLANRNLMYSNFKDGSFSTPFELTQYSYNQNAGFRSTQLVNWQGGIFIFWRVDTDATNYNGPLKYCQINPSNLLVMDAVFASTAWVTARAYHVGDIVVENNILYICAMAHNSGIFATDLANGDWTVLSSYVTPTELPALVNQDVYNVKSDGVNLYFMAKNGGGTQGDQPPIYQNFLDVSPYAHPFWVGGMSIDAFEIAMNGDMVVYGAYVNGPGLVVMRIGGVWQTGNEGNGLSGYDNADFVSGHTYNFSELV